MNKRFVHIREVGIHRAAGIRQDESFRISDLSPNINIIFGPNGAGKSTTCRLIQELLWPGHLERPSVDGVISGTDCDWQINIDAGHVQILRDGRPGAAPDFGPDERRLRYLLGLKQFILGDNDEFAAHVARASQGGYDVERAAEKLGYSHRPTQPQKDSSQLRQREEDVERARTVQRQVDQDARRLEELESALERAGEAERELELLKGVEAYHEAAARCRELERELEAYPDGVARLRGDERERLQEMDRKRRNLEEQLDKEEERRRSAEADLNALRLSDAGVPEDVVSTLRARKNEIDKLDGKISEQKRRRDEAAERVHHALASLGDTFTNEQLERMDALELGDLSELARQADRVRAARAVFAERRTWLEAEEPEEVRSLDADELQDGLHILSNWLSSAGDAQSDVTWRLAGGAAASVVLVVALVAFQLWGWAILAALVAVFIALELWSRRKSMVSPRGAYEEAFRKLSLPQPKTWGADEVSRHARELGRLIQKKTLASERRSRLEVLLAEEADVHQKERELEVRRREVEAALGCEIEVDNEWLPVLVGHLVRWQNATSERRAADHALECMKADREKLLAKFNASLGTYDVAEAASAAEAEQRVADLAQKRQSYLRATKDAEDARRRIDEVIRPGLEELAGERETLRQRLEIGEDEESLIADWLAKRDDYISCKDELARQVAVRDDKEAALSARSDLLEVNAIELESRKQDLQTEADRRDELSEEIGGIKQSIRDAKAGHGLSDALAERDEARTTLERVREDNGSARVGAVLADWVRQVSIDRSRPEVFQRADELFVRFTRGALQLQMDDRSTPPSFRARRGTRPPQSLNELSDGERIQLMTAVRLAFLEQDEATPLPLLVDEVLGMSDDGRSEVMIDTIIEVARRGRQIFYCTAQHDEVGKWVARLRDEEIDYRLIDLAEVRNLSAARTRPLEIVPIEKSAPPPPGSMNYEDYGHALGVANINPRTESVDGIHLWHFFDDTELLYRLLQKDITTWGQLDTLLKHGGAGLIAADDEAFASARAAARAVEAACAAWRVGRGRRVDRAVLQDSGCVSDKFIDEVAELAARAAGDAGAILKSLERGEVKNFYRSKMEELRVYFESEGYLALESTLSVDHIRVRALAAAAQDLREGRIDEDVIDRIVTSVCAQPGDHSAAA